VTCKTLKQSINSKTTLKTTMTLRPALMQLHRSNRFKMSLKGGIVISLLFFYIFVNQSRL
jgi:hypothetical protein